MTPLRWPLAGLAANLDDVAASYTLDCSCGTVLTGLALRDVGAQGTILGVDVSLDSQELARTRGVYDEIQTVDLNARLPFDDGTFAGVLCVGVMSYLEAEGAFTSVEVTDRLPYLPTHDGFAEEIGAIYCVFRVDQVDS
jgi:predicted TPR repeat methyltransferase